MPPGPRDAAARIRDNLARVQQRIFDVAQGVPIRLVCVTKYAVEPWIDLLLDAGAQEIGESQLPQAQQRYQRLKIEGRQFTGHLLGAQQSRKVKSIPDSCDLFQALDREKTATMLNAELVSRDLKLAVLLEVNIDAEPQKHGYLPDDIERNVSELSETCPQLVLSGLMAIPRARVAGEAMAEWESRTRTALRQMRQLFDRITLRFPELADWSILSMGMSQDYHWAIAEGATMVRVGSALFDGLEG